MISFQHQSIDTANSKSKKLLQSALDRIGYIPRIYNMMANSSSLLELYLKGDTLFRSGSTFTPQEKELIYLTISSENNCNYCIAVHSTIAGKASEGLVKSILAKEVIADKQLSALIELTRSLVINRGKPDENLTNALIEAGYSKELILEIILAISIKTISNYSNQFFHTPIDKRFLLG